MRFDDDDFDDDEEYITRSFYLTLQLEGNSYIYVYDEDHELELAAKIFRDAMNPNLNIEVKHALLLLERMKHVKEEADRQADDEPYGGYGGDQQSRFE